MSIRSLALLLVCAAVAQAQTDWPSFGGDGQRSGWEKSDTRITRDNVKDFELVLKRKFVYPHTGIHSLTPPVVVGLLISYRGFKELAFVEDAAGTLWSVDADLNRVFWKRPLGVPASSCGTGMAGMPALVPPFMFGKRLAAGAKRRPSIPGNGFGQVRPVFAVSPDGKLHKLNTSDGTDLSEPLEFLPPNIKPSPLTIQDGTIYASSAASCGGVSGIWAIDLTVPEPKVVSFTWKGASVAGAGGPAFGNDGTVYLETAPNTIQSFTPNDLQPKERITLPGTAPAKARAGINLTTPVVLDLNGQELIVSSSADGRLFLMDGKSPVSETLPLAASGGGIWGGLSSWKDAAGKSWVFAPVWGKLNPDAKVGKTNGPVTHGAIVAFTLEEENGKPVLTPAWTSHDMRSPVPPVITSGALFTVSTAGPAATFYGLDAQTGEELYSSGKQITAPGQLTGLSVSNGRVYFTTTDGTLYAFGVHLEI